VFIDDNRDNVEAARAIGTRWFTSATSRAISLLDTILDRRGTRPPGESD
jgi:hypothetical protein